MLENIICIVTMVITYLLGKLSKKSTFVKNEIIPLQNLLVGVIVAVIYFIITKDFSMAIATAGLFAGGTYDILHNLEKIFMDEEKIDENKK